MTRTRHPLVRRLPATEPAWIRETDAVVIGTGAAGLAAACRLADADVRVAVITKGTLGDGSTAWAQGGLAAVVSGRDSLAQHVEDTLTAGAGLCDAQAVRELVSSAPAAVERLIELGAVFDRDGSGALDLGLEGGHHARRIIHAGGDASGAEVSRVLAGAVWSAVAAGRIEATEHTYALDALLASPSRSAAPRAAGAVCGVRVIDSDGVVGEWRARAVVLATGGIGQLWATTTNPSTSTGDGLALAVRAGAAVRDLEFMQFHPTILAVPHASANDRGRGVLISEAVRGEGAVLVDADGNRVMAGVHPLADLAPRDVVSATMQHYLVEHDLDHLYLDGTHLGAAMWEQHFPSILAMCRDRGIDPVTEPVPVRPAAHYHCGGVVADLDGRTSVRGLFAVGEAACTGVQGANRLASNSITEALVAGDRCGQLLARRLPPRRRPAVAATGGAFVPAAARAMINRSATRNAGVLRDADSMVAMLDQLAGTERICGTPTPADLEATNLHTVGTLVATAALRRTESRGCHRRLDHTRPRPSWLRHLTMIMTAAGTLEETAEGAGPAGIQRDEDAA